MFVSINLFRLRYYAHWMTATTLTVLSRPFDREYEANERYVPNIENHANCETG